MFRLSPGAPGGSIERIYSDLCLGLARMQASGPAAPHVHLRRAAELALELDDSAAFFAAASWAVARLRALRDYELRGRVATEALRRPREGARARDLSLVLNQSAQTVFDRGDREAAEEAWREMRQLAERTRDVSADQGASAATAALAFTDGRLEEARSLFDSIRARAEALGVGTFGTGGFGAQPLLDARVRYFLAESVEPMLAAVSGPGRVAQAQRAVILSWLGRVAEVRAIRERFGDVGADTDETNVFILVNLLEASLGVGDAETAGALLRRLAPLAGHLSLITGVSIGRLVSDAAALLGQSEAARGYYAQALEVCERVRFRPEIALTRLALAELLLDHFPVERDQALAHLDFAIMEFREMKMRPALERALRRKGLLSA